MNTKTYPRPGFQAKSSGMIAGGRILAETATTVTFRCLDEKRHKILPKNHPTTRVFENYEVAAQWVQEQNRNG